MSKKNKKIDKEILKPIFETLGEGKIICEDGFENNVKFWIKLNQNGITTGELEFINIKNPKLLEYLRRSEHFKIRGINKEGENVAAKECFITGIHEKWNKVISVKAKISIGKLEFPYREISRDSKGIQIKFYVTNMFSTFRVILDTEIGELRINHFRDIEKLESMMKEYNTPLITSVISLHIPKDKVTTTQETITMAREFIANFLKLTSLAQTSWHSVVAVSAYEIKCNEQMPRIFFEIIHTKIKQPGNFGLTDKISIAYFLKSVLKGYSKKIDKKHGFSYALEWYVDSWNSGNLETRFLCATTSLELLLEKFHFDNNTEFLISDDKFEKFRKKIKNQMKQILIEMNVDDKTQSLMYNGIDAMQRRSYRNKAKMLLEHWEIKYDDLEITLEEIIKIRNKITHMGRVKTVENDDSILFRAYKGIFVLLTRIFLAMLNFDFEYWDIIKRDYVKFTDVRIV